MLIQYIFNIVWMYTYSIRLFLIEAKHRYKGKNINRRHTLKIYKVQKEGRGTSVLPQQTTKQLFFD